MWVLVVEVGVLVVDCPLEMTSLGRWVAWISSSKKVRLKKDHSKSRMVDRKAVVIQEGQNRSDNQGQEED